MSIDVDALRAEFPVLEHTAYFTCNGLGPIPRRTRDAIVDAVDAYFGSGIMAHFAYTDVLQTTRERGAAIMGAEPDEIAFVQNTSHGVLLASHAIRWRDGDEVIVPFRDYPILVYPFKHLEQQGRVRLVMPEMEEPIPEARRLTLDVIASAVTDRTRAVAISYVQFDNGYRADLEAIGAFCRERDILFIVDAIQGLGAIPLDVRRAQIDFLAAGGHKWMWGTQGTGLYYVRRELLDELERTDVSFTGMTDSGKMDTDTHAYPGELRPGTDRFEVGSRNLLGIIGQRESLGLLLELGIDAVGARIKELTDYLCAGAEAKGCTLLSDRSEGAWSGICLFAPPPGRDAGEIMSEALGQGILLNNHEGAVHMGVHAYNTREEIDRVLALL